MPKTTAYVIVDTSSEDEVTVLPRAFATKAAAKEHVEAKNDVSEDDPMGVAFEWDGDDLVDPDGRTWFMVRPVKVDLAKK